MTSVETIRYSIGNFQTIKDDGFLFELPPHTIDMINKIAEQVGSHGYIKTPTFNKRMKKKVVDIDPEILAKFTFKSYVRNDEVTVTVETLENDIRTRLNKLTSSNYDKMFDEISGYMNQIIGVAEDNDDEPFNKVCNHIFDYATTNKVGVETYAKMYVNLMDKFPALKMIFDKKFSNYISMFNKIDQNDGTITDYNYFCKISKINQQRRVFSLFVIELYKNGIVKIDDIVSIIISLQTDILYSVNWNNESTKCEEIGENVYVFIENMCHDLMKHHSWETIYSNIVSTKNLSVKDIMSMSNKIKFRHMDMEDVIKKSGVYKPPSV